MAGLILAHFVANNLLHAALIKHMFLVQDERKDSHPSYKLHEAKEEKRKTLELYQEKEGGSAEEQSAA